MARCDHAHAHGKFLRRRLRGFFISKRAVLKHYGGDLLNHPERLDEIANDIAGQNQV